MNIKNPLTSNDHKVTNKVRRRIVSKSEFKRFTRKPKTGVKELIKACSDMGDLGKILQYANTLLGVPDATVRKWVKASEAKIKELDVIAGGGK